MPFFVLLGWTKDLLVLPGIAHQFAWVLHRLLRLTHCVGLCSPVCLVIAETRLLVSPTRWDLYGCSPEDLVVTLGFSILGWRIHSVYSRERVSESSA